VLEDRAAPAILTVTTLSDLPTHTGASLRDALLLANADAITGQSDLVTFDSGLSGQTITLRQGVLGLTGHSLTTPATITIDGDSGITIDGGNLSGVFRVDFAVQGALNGLTITRGRGTSGGIYNRGTLAVSNCTLSGCSAFWGGGIYNDGTLTVSDCTLMGNSAYNGAGIFSSGSVTVSDSALASNSAGDLGGGLYTNHQMTVAGCDLGADSAFWGGGIYNDGGTLDVSSCTIRSSSASQGGGIFNDGPLTATDCVLTADSATRSGGGIFNDTLMTVRDGLVNANSAPQGGGIFNDGGTVTLSDSTFQANSAGSSGGGFYNQGRLTLSNSSFLSNSATTASGGGIYTNTLLMATDCDLRGNSAFRGGGLFNDGGTMTGSGCTLAGNSARTTGGGLFNQGTLTVSNVVLDANSAQGDGGGIYDNGTLTASGYTVSGNTAARGGGIFTDGGVLRVSDWSVGSNSANQGGGLFNQGGQVALAGSTLSDNSSSNRGGGIYNQGTLELSNVTLAANSASQGGGCYNLGNPMTVADCTGCANSAAGQGGGIYNDNALSLESTIVAGNSSGSGNSQDVWGQVSGPSGYNLIGMGDDNLIGIHDGVNRNQIGTASSPLDPRLAPLGDYGGPTSTFALLPGSPALGEGGAPTTLATALTASTTSVRVSNASFLGVVPGSTVLLLDSEEVFVSALASGILTVVRGYNGTNPDTHVANIPVYPAGDQRGLPRLRDGGIDIGAYQSQGFTLIPLPSDTVSTVVGTAFAARVRLLANDPGLSDFSGSVLTLAVTTAANGASAALGSGTTIFLTNQSDYDLDASANTTAGSYTLTVESRAGSSILGLSNTPDVPFSITVSGGDQQSTLVNTTFDDPLLVTVTDQYGNPVAGVSVIFTGSGGDADASFSDGGVVSTDDNGQAWVFATANDVAGTYSVTASAEGVNSVAVFLLTNRDEG
jgi:predicted outer membrane repeat protein